MVDNWICQLGLKYVTEFLILIGQILEQGTFILYLVSIHTSDGFNYLNNLMGLLLWSHLCLFVPFPHSFSDKNCGFFFF